MTDKSREAHISELEERLRLLSIENDHLAERAEETLLLGLIAEKINSSTDVDELINVGLEQTAVLKDIPYVACFTWAGDQAWNLHSYTIAQVTQDEDLPVTLGGELLKSLETGGCTLLGDDHEQFPFFPGSGQGFQPTATILLPLRNRFGNQMVFVFSTDSDEERLGAMDRLLPRVVEIISSRIDNLELLQQLTTMNERLDLKVQERTEALGASENRIRTLFERAFDGFLVIDQDLIIRDVNQQACENLGYTREELVGRTILGIPEGMTAEKIESIWSRAIDGEVLSLESRHRRKDGTSFPVDARVGAIELDGQPMLLAQARDVSERNRLLEQLNQAQKMEAVGRLAGGIAHDFNNILTAIMGHVDMLKMDLENDHPAQEDLDLIQETSERAAGLTRQLLAFSRKQVMDMGPFDLSQSISAMSRMLLRMIDESIELKIELDQDARFIYGDPIRIEQILMNLVINARDSMPDGGRISVQTLRVPPEDGFLGSHPDGPQTTGQYLMIQVTDTGKGIPEDIQANIFDPFFTTKGVGKGTGLGLAMVYGLAQQHNALIRVRSVVGQGSVFEVVFPEIEAPEDEDEGRSLEAIPRGAETILLVEDDSTIRTVISRMIEKLGYTLLVAENGTEALEVIGRHDSEVDLVLTDVIMPRMGGGDLVRELKKTHTRIKVIYMSGYTDDTVGRADLAVPGTRFLQKPVSYHQLARELRSALDKPLGQ